MRRRILIVDDETDLARLMGNRLAMAEFEPWTAANGQQGIEILNEKEMDLVIVDVVMPQMDGYTLCKMMKVSQNFSHLPIIVSTAYPEREGDFRRIGVDEFMIKPIDPQKLIETIERVLSRHPHKRRHKIVVFDKEVNPGVQMAITQFHDMGFKLEADVVQDNAGLIQDVLRKQPDIFLLDVRQPDMPAPEIVRQLRGFVMLRDMNIFVYSSAPAEEKPKKRKISPEHSIIQQCLDAGATKCVSPWDRETFLSVLFEYCRS